MIDFIATSPHYWDHLKPVYDELASRGVEVKAILQTDPILPSNALTVVASYGDMKAAQNVGRHIVYMEHGAGQSYSKQHGSFAGGRNRRGVLAFLSPGPHVTEANRIHHRAVHREVGVPKLDRWHRSEPKPQGSPPVVCVSFHWDCHLLPETRNAWAHFKDAIVDLKQVEGIELIGHCHPRARPKLQPWYEENGIEFVRDFSNVLDRADLYVCDNSSTIFEFASTNRPVVLMNPPWYRREVKHGLRFWKESKVGLNCDDPDDLSDTVMEALSDPPRQREARQASIARVYSYTDGHAAERAADAIQEVSMAQEKQQKNAYVLRALRTVSGHYGLVGPGWTVHLLPDRTIEVYNKRGMRAGRNVVSRLAPEDPSRYAQTLTQDRGRLTQFELVSSPDSGSEAKKAPIPAQDKKAPTPTEDKKAPTPAEDKESSTEFSELEKAILKRVKAGDSKGTLAKELRQSDEWTDAEVRETFDALIKAGVILKDGPDNRPTYTVAE